MTRHLSPQKWCFIPPAFCRRKYLKKKIHPHLQGITTVTVLASPPSLRTTSLYNAWVQSTTTPKTTKQEAVLQGLQGLYLMLSYLPPFHVLSLSLLASSSLVLPCRCYVICPSPPALPSRWALCEVTHLVKEAKESRVVRNTVDPHKDLLKSHSFNTPLPCEEKAALLRWGKWTHVSSLKVTRCIIFFDGAIPTLCSPRVKAALRRPVAFS